MTLRLRKEEKGRNDERKRLMQREGRKKKKQLQMQPSWPRRKQGNGRRSLKGIWRRVKERKRQLERG